MATRARAGDILGDWHHLIDGLQASALDFYAKLEAALEPRQLPDASRSRIDWKEAGAFSAGREYLRLTRARHVMDICGAPFGSGFFVSWWLARGSVSPVIPTIAA